MVCQMFANTQVDEIASKVFHVLSTIASSVPLHHPKALYIKLSLSSYGMKFY